MSTPQNFVLATYTFEGKLAATSNRDISELDSKRIAEFSKKLSTLSGDLELPYEDRLSGDIDFIEYRIGSDLNGAYLLYYFHDEVVFASLMLSGVDEEQETELMQVFKFLLLDSSDDDEPTEEDIEAVLALDDFDFPSVVERPAVFQIRLSEFPEEAEACRHIEDCNQHLAAAFFALDRQQE